VAALLYRRHARQRQERTGAQLPVLMPMLGLVLLPPILVFLVTGAVVDFSIPTFQRFNYQGGQSLTPEFLALLVGLSLYTGAFIAENVRSGILGVSWGQTEAAAALGLRRGQQLTLVILPQALRIIIPPTTSQYLNITKNSSLAVAIGYPDLVSIANTSLNQTGQAIECISIMMAIYLSISLGISAFMNWYNARVALVER
jgi:general L-amino acid transport system permease protein